MAAPTICSVTGTLRTMGGAVLVGATVKANCVRPFIHPTDNSLVTNYEVTTVTDSSGNWSLSLIETTTPSVSLTITFYYPSGSANPNDRKEYTIIVPNSASATFQSLIGTQV